MKSFNFEQDNVSMQFLINDDNEIRLIDFCGICYEKEKNESLMIKSYLVELQISGGENFGHRGARHISTSEATTLKYVEHSIITFENKKTLKIVQKNLNFEVKTYYEVYYGTNTLRSYNEIENISEEKICVEHLSSFALYGVFGDKPYEYLDYYIPTNSWHCECQWRKVRLMDLGIFSGNHSTTLKRVNATNTGSWSSKEQLPMGMVEDTRNNQFLLFQIENNGSWHYEIGDYFSSIYFNIGGPNLSDNLWSKFLNPGEKFVSVIAAITVGNSVNSVFGNITRYRRGIRRKNEDNEKLPTIFNEYMHCAWNFPTEENSKKLAKYAALLGIDYYVIDCAWHDEEDDCWLYIGNWIESKKRYPNGLKNTLDYIKGLGLKTGLWLELEAVGIRGNAIDMWEDDCFFQRNGKKVINSGRYQLDFRNQKVIKRMNELIDRVVNDYEVDYIKIDYNQCSGPGTDLNSCSLGDGLLDHSRAYRCWIESVFKKYPDLVIENCASGGQRMDYALMSLHSIQSTSDQTDYKKYPYIVSNMITAVTPEQSAVWSYPIEDKQDVLTVTNESVAMNMINSMLGRLHLSSSIDLLDAEKTALIKEGIQYYNLMSDNKKHSDPYWPLGLCYWGEKTAIAGIKTDRICYLSVYNLGSDGTVEIPLQDLNISSIKVGYPKEMNTNYQYDNKKLTVKFEKEFEARLFEIELEKGD